MKIILDTDGTMTDFNKFIQNEAIPYFEKNYSMTVVSPNSLEIQDIFDMDSFFARKNNCSLEEAKKYTKQALDSFWVHPRYLKYALFSKFREGLNEYIKKMIKDGHDIEIHTSRDKTTDKNAIGKIARGLTRLQYSLNGLSIPKDKFFFYKNDEEKIKGIIDSKPDIVFDDKKEIIDQLNNSNIKCICINGLHNEDVTETKKVYKSTGAETSEVIDSVVKLLGENKMNIYKKSASSDKFYNKISCVKPILTLFFKPVILHGENIMKDDDKPIIYAPNHRSTLDPLVINAIVDKHIHWAALLRFFQAKDSIFNNSKNKFLCDLTAKTFKKLEFIPIDRKKDNPDANNFRSVIDMIGLLRINKKIGIFPEGTTSRPEGQEFGHFDPGFIAMAKKTGATIQPITTYWFKDNEEKRRVVINFGKPIVVGKENDEIIYNEYLNIQEQQLEENKNESKMYNDDVCYKKSLLKNSKKYYN